MTKAITLIFPHQLFREPPGKNTTRPVYLVEEWLFFRQYSFHKQKLVLHRASMRFYYDYLSKQKFKVIYIEAFNKNSDVRNLIAALASEGVSEIHYTDTCDEWLEKRIRQTSDQYAITLIQYNNPNFITGNKEGYDFFNNRKTYFQTDFYKWQRKSLQILLLPNGEPEGGKWSFDDENRKPIKKGESIPAVNFCILNSYVKEAMEYVDTHFAENYGCPIDDEKQPSGFYPTTFEEAETWLDIFLKDRFKRFGCYEDAIKDKESILFHSVLTPMLNIGLLDPHTIVKKALEAAPKYAVPINSLEGFIRQIIGWREFIRIVYTREGNRQRTKNFWNFNRTIPASFWTGTTGIYPVDSVIHKLLRTGYNHHIERLMVMGNFMLLCEFHPTEVYKWFMEMYIDSYDWVMVPNVYGMTQFADGGLMTTKPYISGSNYLMKMSDYPKGDWQKIWDGLFWRFMHVHRDILAKNMRLNMLIKTFDKMSEAKQNLHLETAELFLHSLDKQG